MTGRWVFAGAMCFALPVVSGQLPAARPTATAASSPRAVLDKYCVTCHNQRAKTAGLMLDGLDTAEAGDRAETWEKVLFKISTGAMPPPGRPRPDTATHDAFVSWLEEELDGAARRSPNPGSTTLHRLNRTEYANAIRDLLGLEIDGAALLPVDNAAYGFDNIADALSLSPALTERYLGAAATISHLALGRVMGSPSPETYAVPTDLDQRSRVSEELPIGSRGGMAIHHYFPVDGEYLVQMRLQERGSGRFGPRDEPSTLDVRLDGVKVWTYTGGGQKPRGKPKPEDGEIAATDALEFHFRVKAGAHLVQVFFVPRTSASLEDLIEPDLRTKYLPGNGSGDPALSTVTITGPYDAARVGDSPTRQRILVCRPVGPAGNGESTCAKRIISTLARRAYRRPVTDVDLEALLTLYRQGALKGGFELGIEVALRGILVSPEFLFRFEGQPRTAAANAPYRIADIDLASRLSFFLWCSIPADELLDVAAQGQLQKPAVLERQVRRMLEDQRSAALVSNFAGQWLQLRNVAGVSPSPELFFDHNLRQAFQRETELFFESILREDRSVLEFLDADYTFVNERLARHYGIPGVYGERFRRVALPADSVRRGLLGQGSILTVTSFSYRTSPVRRGKWILDNILGAPPPPPPPNVPVLEDHGNDGKTLSAREQMMQHRNNPACASCHSQMDPLGFALENLDAVGRWRVVDGSNAPIDASGTLPDGTSFQGPVGLRQELLKNRSRDFVMALTQKLLTYALGRGLEYYDAPTIREITRQAALSKHRFSSLIIGIVRSVPFQMKMAREPERSF
jgi:mono/diheme cytochrome c family protein